MKTKVKKEKITCSVVKSITFTVEGEKELSQLHDVMLFYGEEIDCNTDHIASRIMKVFDKVDYVRNMRKKVFFDEENKIEY